jgi:hypothetical protein
MDLQGGARPVELCRTPLSTVTLNRHTSRLTDFFIDPFGGEIHALASTLQRGPVAVRSGHILARLSAAEYMLQDAHPLEPR